MTAAVVQDYLGGELRVAEVHNADGSRLSVHYWNRLPDGSELDFTREQFRAGEVVGDPAVVPHVPEPRAAERLAQQYQRLAVAVRQELSQGAVEGGAEVSAPGKSRPPTPRPRM